jgi:hypothetical protein
VLALVTALDQIKELERQIADAVHAQPDDEIFLSLFRTPSSVVRVERGGGASTLVVLCAATLLAEIGDCRARYPTADALAGDAVEAMMLAVRAWVLRFGRDELGPWERSVWLTGGLRPP